MQQDRSSDVGCSPPWMVALWGKERPDERWARLAESTSTETRCRVPVYDRPLINGKGRVVAHVWVDADYIETIFDQVEIETGRRPTHLYFVGRALKPVVV